MAEKKKHTVLKTVGTLAGIGLGLYVGNEIRKEYNSTVKENEYLRKFINTHDFYEKENSSFSATTMTDQKQRMSSGSKLTHVEDLGDKLRVTTVDPVSGFSVVSIKNKDNKSDLTNNAKEA